MSSQSLQLSTNGLLVFKSDLTNGKDLRVVGTVENPLFIGKDIAKMLGYTNSMKAIRDHIEIEDKIIWENIQNIWQNESFPLKLQPQTYLINESGLYSLILRSKLESAKKFKKWVTSEVLPSEMKKLRNKIDET
jgi:anti-repressor protein